MYRRTWLALVASAPMLFLSCAPIPIADIEASEATLRAALAAEASDYAPAEWRRARDLLASAMAEVEAEKRKLAVLRNYQTALQLLEESREAATEAAAQATEAKELAVSEAESLLGEAGTGIAAAERAIASAPGHLESATIEVMRSELRMLTASLESARRSFSDGRYLDVIAEARSIKQGARDVVEGVTRDASVRRRV